MVHIKNLEKFAENNPCIVPEEVLMKARKLAKPWKGLLLGGDVQILLGIKTSKKFFDAYESSKEHKEITETEVGKIPKIQKLFERFQKVAKKVNEEEMMIFMASGGHGGEDVVVPTGEKRATFSLLIAKAKKKRVV